MRVFAAVLVLVLAMPAWAFPAIGTRVYTFPEDTRLRIVDFTFRNTTEETATGYYYEVALYDLRGERIFERGQVPGGYMRRDIAPGEMVRDRVWIEATGVPVRAEVDITLIAPTEDGERLIR